MIHVKMNDEKKFETGNKVVSSAPVEDSVLNGINLTSQKRFFKLQQTIKTMENSNLQYVIALTLIYEADG